MKNVYIKQIFEDWDALRLNGVWFSGNPLEGEYRAWHSNGQLYMRCFYKDGKMNGEYRRWRDNGKLITYKLYKNGRVEKVYLK